MLARRDKVAFEPPEASWLASEPWRERLAEVLLDSSTKARGLYDCAAIETDLRAGVWRDHGAVWRAFCAERLEACICAVGAAPGGRPLASEQLR